VATDFSYIPQKTLAGSTAGSAKISGFIVAKAKPVGPGLALAGIAQPVSLPTEEPMSQSRR
jgi:hypothetical protein